MSEYEATEVRRELDKLDGRYDAAIEGFSDTIEEATREVVEDGSMIPNSDISGHLALTLRERLRGEREQSFTGIFAVGIRIGCALERDAPKDSDAEQAWLDGEFVLPESES